MSAKRKKALGPSELVGAWYDLKAEIDRGANRLSGMVAQAEKLRERLETEYGISVPSLAFRVGTAASGEPEVIELAAPGIKSTGVQLPITEEEQTRSRAGTFIPPRQGPIAGSEAGAQVDDTVAKARAEAAIPGPDPKEFAASIAATFAAVRSGYLGG